MKTVVISGARSLPALHIARSLSASGMRVLTTDSLLSSTTGASRASQKYYRSPSPKRDTENFFKAVAKLLKEEKPDLWIPTCEEIFYLAKGRDILFPGIPLFAPSFNHLAQFHNKARFAKFVETLGIASAETHKLIHSSCVDALIERSREFVFKPVWSRGGTRVLNRPSAAELENVCPTERDPWIAQTYLPGEEICTYSIANQGRMLAHVSYRPRYRVKLGAAIAFDQVEDAEARSFAESFIATTTWHGQLGFDMRRDADGCLIPIECNPRATSGIHFLGQHNLAAAIFGHQVEPEMHDQMSMIVLSMLTYGLPTALLKGTIYDLSRDFRNRRDILWSRSDPLPTFQQLFFILEIFVLAIRHRISTGNAFTDDLEWDGKPFA